MLRTPRFSFIAFLATPVLATPLAHGDIRHFTRTYEYQTMPAGEVELETYNTQRRPSFDSEAGQRMDFQLEVEYGITDHWDVSLYQVFAQGADAGLGFSETKLRTRYRFAERGEWPIDTLAYFEVIKPFGEDAVELEGKAILARDLGPLSLALNLIGEVALGDETEVVPGYALGATYPVTPRWSLGAESWGELKKVVSATGGERRELEAWAGPAITWAPGSNIWIAATAGFGLSSEADDLITRFIIGLHL